MIHNNLKKPVYWSAAVRHLHKADPTLSVIIKKYKSKTFLTRTNSIFTTFFKIIIGQQISIEAANSIESKIIQRFGRITPKKILNIKDEELRNCGLSYRKVNYIKGIAEMCKQNNKFFRSLKNMDDEKAIDKLISIYGIGKWSAEMFLIFNQNRMNILPLGDIGLINSFCKNYKISRDQFMIKIDRYKRLWDPYCSVATWYLWRDIDEDVVQY